MIRKNKVTSKLNNPTRFISLALMIKYTSKTMDVMDQILVITGLIIKNSDCNNY